MIQDPSAEAIRRDLEDTSFKAGVARSQWKLFADAFPVLQIDVSATEPDGTVAWYRFRFEVSGYPGNNPEVRIWDSLGDCALPADRRPKGNAVVLKTFQVWTSDTVYRPWERTTKDHNNFHSSYPHLAWHSKRKLTFILEDLHEILNLNSRTVAPRAAS